MRQVVTIVCSGVLLAVIACNAGGSGGTSGCETGSEGCDCYPNETCDSGLSCTDELKCEDEAGSPSSSGSGSGGNGSGGTTGSGGSGSGGDTSTNTGGAETGSGGSSSSSGGSNSNGTGGNTSGSGGATSGSGGATSGSGGATNGSGGATNGSGGATNGSGGATNGSGGATNGSGGSGGTPTTPGLIDDFADCDEAIPEIEGRNGGWFTFASDETYIESAIGLAPSSTETSWGDQTCGAFINGLCPGCDTAGIGVILNDGVYDLSSYVGIRFTIESAGPVYVAVKTTNSSDYGYAWGAVAYTGSTSATRTLYFADLEPDAAFHGFDQVQEIQFTVDDYGKEYGFRLAVHHLELIE